MVSLPYYNFVCKQCGHQFEVKVAVSEKSGVKCPECSSDMLRQIFSGVGLIRKSGGVEVLSGQNDACDSCAYGGAGGG